MLRITVFTNAVFPVPGAPDINMLVVSRSWSMEAPSINEFRNSSREVSSVSRPAIEEDTLLQVERSKARTRAWIGSRDAGGLGGGVEIVSSIRFEVGVAGSRDEAEVCRRTGVDRWGTVFFLKKKHIHTSSTTRGRDDWFGGIPSEGSDRPWGDIDVDGRIIDWWYVFLIGIAIYDGSRCSSAFWIGGIVRRLQLFAGWIGWGDWRGILMSPLAKYCAPSLHSVINDLRARGDSRGWWTREIDSTLWPNYHRSIWISAIKQRREARRVVWSRAIMFLITLHVPAR